MPRARVTPGKKSMWAPLVWLWPRLWKHRGRVLFALAFLALARLANVSVPLILKRIVDALEGGAAGIVPGVALIPLALLAGYGLLRFGSVAFNEARNVIFSSASVQIVRDISTDVFRHLHTLPLGFHLDRRTGELSRTIERGTGAVAGFLRMFVFNIIPVLFELTAVMLILWTSFAPVFVQVTMAMLLIYIVFTIGVTHWRTKYRIEMNKSESKAHGIALDALLNYETVRIFGNESLESKRYDKSLIGWRRASLKSYHSLAALNIGQAAIVASGMTMLMVLAARGVADDIMTLGDFVMVNAFLIQLYIPLNFMGSIYRDINHSLIDMKKMFDLFDQKPEAERRGARALKLRGGEIYFERVSFRYHGQREVLRDIDFRVPGGSMTAVVGPSGAGKSTISRLLLRFYDPARGRILIDGQDIRDVTLSSLRAEMGVVPQDTVLFNATIGYNIGYGLPHASEEEIARVGKEEIERARKKEIARAAKLARLDGFIAQHPQGYKVMVGERGLKLSGGEKQRVAIARAALKDAPILIFDEATSSLDSRSEKAIQQALERVSKNSTTLVIAHRLSTITAAAQIIVLDKGGIAERGTHEELLARGGLYAQMWKLQEEAERNPVE